MSSESFALRIEREVIDGRGRVYYTIGPDLLSRMLTYIGVTDPHELPDVLWRDLCRQAGQADLQRMMERAEERHPGSTVVGLTSTDAPPLYLRPDDLGFEMVSRLMPEESALETLFDPQYSTVDFELRVFDEQHLSEPERAVGRTILSVTLEPPDLA